MKPNKHSPEEIAKRLKALQRWHSHWNGVPMGWIKAQDVWDIAESLAVQPTADAGAPLVIERLYKIKRDLWDFAKMTQSALASDMAEQVGRPVLQNRW